MASFSVQGGRLRLEAHAREELPPAVPGEDRWLEHTTAALTALSERMKPAGPVTLVLPPHATLAKIVRMPRFERAKREKVIRFAAEENIPCALVDVVWGHVAAAEHDLEVLLAAVKRELVEPLCAAARAAGFAVELVLPGPLATLAAFRLVPEEKEPTLVLNLGARSTTLLVATGRRFVLRTLALGFQGQEKADAATVAVRLGQEITRSILHFRRLGGLEDPVRVQLMGGGAQLAGLPEALGAVLKLPVNRVDMPALIDRGSEMSVNETAAAAVSLADLAGAAAIRLRADQTVMNLLPRCPRRTDRRHRYQLATVVLAIGLGGLLFWRERRPAVAAAPVFRGAVAAPAAPAPVSPVAIIATESQPVEVAPVELEPVEAKPEPGPLQLAGYFGGPKGYLVAFNHPGKGAVLLARPGQRLGSLGLTLRSFEVRKVPLDRGESWPACEVAGFAVMREEENGRELVLDSRRAGPAEAFVASGL